MDLRNESDNGGGGEEPPPQSTPESREEPTTQSPQQQTEQPALQPDLFGLPVRIFDFQRNKGATATASAAAAVAAQDTPEEATNPSQTPPSPTNAPKTRKPSTKGKKAAPLVPNTKTPTTDPNKPLSGFDQVRALRAQETPDYPAVIDPALTNTETTPSPLPNPNAGSGGFFRESHARPGPSRQNRMTWNTENDMWLLLFGLNRDISHQETELIARFFPNNPTPKAIEERLTKLRKKTREVLKVAGIFDSEAPRAAVPPPPAPVSNEAASGHASSSAKKPASSTQKRASFSRPDLTTQQRTPSSQKRASSPKQAPGTTTQPPAKKQRTAGAPIETFGPHPEPDGPSSAYDRLLASQPTFQQPSFPYPLFPRAYPQAYPAAYPLPVPSVPSQGHAPPPSPTNPAPDFRPPHMQPPSAWQPPAAYNQYQYQVQQPAMQPPWNPAPAPAVYGNIVGGSSVNASTAASGLYQTQASSSAPAQFGTFPEEDEAVFESIEGEGGEGQKEPGDSFGAK